MYHGSGGGVGLDRWRLVGFSMEISGFLGGFLGVTEAGFWILDLRLAWIDRDWRSCCDVCCVCGFVSSSDGGFDDEFFFFFFLNGFVRSE